MAIVLTNALLFDLDPPRITKGPLRIEDGLISAVGNGAKPRRGDTIVDCGGAVVMAGLVNGHAHLYSALAAGMPMPPKMPRNFPEVLEFIWWRLDRALDEESIELSGAVGALDALRCGTTTLIDHHASPCCIPDSLDMLERGIDAVGLRAVLCYEVTDRNGRAGTEAGIEENRRYIEKSQKVKKSKSQNAGTAKAKRVARRFAGMMGAHAAFTLSDASLRRCVEIAADLHAGLHIHVAEDPADDLVCRRKYGAPLLRRLEKCGLLDKAMGVGARSILAHGTHLSPEDGRCVSAQVAAVAHNPRSNMNNRVGYTPVGWMTNVLLGTDGIGSDMFTEARHAWFKGCDATAPGQSAARRVAPTPSSASRAKPPTVHTPARVGAMLAHSARVAGDMLGGTLGRLTPGAAADVVITDYVPATPLDSANAPAHLIFAIGPQHVRHVLVAGRWALRDRQPVQVKETEIRQRASRAAAALWRRMQAL
jgi:putative selenium metabolism protein SsnA